MITPKNYYDATKSRENKRTANEYCFSAIGDHTNETGVVFPSKTAGDVEQLRKMGKIGKGTNIIAFEDGTYLCDVETKKPENWEGIVQKDITLALDNALGYEGNESGCRKYDIIAQDAKWAKLCEVYKDLDFGIYDFCCGPSCFAKWLIRYHLNAYKIGADLTFTICLGGKAALNGIGNHIANASDDDNNLINVLDVEHFTYVSEYALTTVKKMLNYISRWIKVEKVSIYKDKDANGYGDAMCCFCGKLQKHFSASDEEFVQPETKIMESSTKKFVFLKKFGAHITNSLQEFFDKNGYGKKHLKSSLLPIACKGILSSVQSFNADRAFKTKWIMQIACRIAQENGFALISNVTRKYFYFEKLKNACVMKETIKVATNNDVLPLCDILEAQAVYMNKKEFNFFDYKCDSIMNFLLEMDKVAKKLNYMLRIENDGTIKLVDKND